MSNLLTLATPQENRLKLLLFGDVGTGKTVTSLSFPNPAVIDTENGTLYYSEHFKFHRTQTTEPAIVKAVIDELLEDPKDFKTFVIDSFTVIYDSILNNHEKRMKLKTGNINYVLQPLDYKFIKAEVKGIILKLLALDMNVIVTAHSTNLYSDSEFMKIIGSKAEGPKQMPYMFDVVLRLTKTGPTEFWAEVDKDRTNKLPAKFEFSYQSFVKYLGADYLERAPVVFKQKQNLDIKSERSHTIKINKKEIKTAGIDADNYSKLLKLAEQVDENTIINKLQEDFNISSILDLKNDEAALLIQDLETQSEPE